MLLCRFVTDNNAIDDNILHAVNKNINIRSLIIKLSFKVLHLVLYLSLRTGQVGFFFYLYEQPGQTFETTSPFQVDRARQIVKDRCSAGTKLLDSG